jgi:UDP-N-acetylmuramate--alanine ligase
MKVHFIGIGGIGASALARYYLGKAHEVSGSDLSESEITKALEKLGAKVYIGRHKAKNVAQDVDLVVFSPAITPDNPELKKAKEWGIKRQSYPEALGELTKKYFTIAVTGTHGKGTTTALISLILIRAGFDPTVIIGTKLKEFNDSNFRAGRSRYLIIEADEYKSSFLNYWPKAIVLTTIDKDHLDYFKSLANIIKVFEKFIGHLPKDGTLIINRGDINSVKLKVQILKLQLKTKSYFLGQKETKSLKKILKVPGEHIAADALAALTLARTLKIPDKISFKALSNYHGAWRRFEQKTVKARGTSYQLISDYAHHPTEVAVTLKAVRDRYPKKRIWCVFQPHQYQRTFYLFKEFVQVLSQAPVDKLILADIYSVAGRESSSIKKKVSSAKLVSAIAKSSILHMPTIGKIAVYLQKNIGRFDVLVVMGAGDIYNLLKFLDN